MSETTITEGPAEEDRRICSWPVAPMVEGKWGGPFV